MQNPQESAGSEKSYGNFKCCIKYHVCPRRAWAESHSCVLPHATNTWVYDCMLHCSAYRIVTNYLQQLYHIHSTTLIYLSRVWESFQHDFQRFSWNSISFLINQNFLSNTLVQSIFFLINNWLSKNLKSGYKFICCSNDIRSLFHF